MDLGLGKMDLTRSMVVSAMSCQRSHMVSSPTQPSPSRPVYFTLHGGERRSSAEITAGEHGKIHIFRWLAFFFHVHVYAPYKNLNLTQVRTSLLLYMYQIS